MSEFDAIPSATITADLGQGVVEQAVTSWSINRTLSGGGLPGQARAASGSSVGSGSVSVESDATPWNAGAIKPAGQVTVSASEDTGAAASRVGTMVVRSVGAQSALSSERDLSIEDDLGGLRGPVTMPASVSSVWFRGGDSISLGVPTDASWAIVTAARSGGFYTYPAPAPSCVYSLSLEGAVAPERGAAVSSNISNWVTTAGRVHADPIGSQVVGEAAAELPLAGQSFYLYASAPTRRIGLTRIGPAGYFNITPVSGSTTSARLGILGGGGVDFPTDAADGTWQRYAFEIQVIGYSAGASTVDGFRVRARTRLGAWSAWVNHTFSSPRALGPLNGTSTSITTDGRAAGFQVTLSDEASMWDASNTSIAHADSALDAILLPRSTSAWSLIQEVTAATLGGSWLNEDGVLTYRNREQLRGQDGPTETVYSLDSLDDVPWEVSTDDVADRVEVSYSPPAITRSANWSVTVWQSTEVVTVRAGQTVVIEQDIDGAAADLGAWRPVWDTLYPATVFSRWAASTLPGGGGPQPADNALEITAEMVNPSRVRIRIRNTTAGTLYTAGSDGTTLLTLRANIVARPSEPLTIYAGRSETPAVAPLSIDLGSWVQDAETAQEILSWLYGTLSQPLPILRQVGVTPKASRRLGDVIVIRDPYTELASKALITGIHSSGEAGRYSQSLDLAILATTFDDMDTWSAANGITTFDQLDAFLIANGIDTFDKWDAYTARIGGNL